MPVFSELALKLSLPSLQNGMSDPITFPEDEVSTDGGTPPMSAFGGKADIDERQSNVRF
jgi:hypothetical protein